MLDARNALDRHDGDPARLRLREHAAHDARSTARLANVTDERIAELIDANLGALETILRWNRSRGIQVFRLTSNLIPFGSHPANTLPWWEVFADRFLRLGRLMRSAGMRISTHPGQYIVLSSIHEDVVKAAIAELDYHDRILSAFGLGHSHKIVLHLGTGVADQRSAYDRFAAGYARLSPGAARRLVLENDERWPLDTTLDWAKRLGLPVVFDAFHHELAPSMEPLTVRELVLRAAETWTPPDGRQEVHFSTQAPGKQPGAHAETIDIDAFARFAEEVGDLPLDCILEVKDKERSVLRARELALPIAADPRVSTGDHTPAIAPRRGHSGARDTPQHGDPAERSRARNAFARPAPRCADHDVKRAERRVETPRWRDRRCSRERAWDVWPSYEAAGSESFRSGSRARRIPARRTMAFLIAARSTRAGRRERRRAPGARRDGGPSGRRPGAARLEATGTGHPNLVERQMDVVVPRHRGHE